jgi:hypothetical protein
MTLRANHRARFDILKLQPRIHPEVTPAMPLNSARVAGILTDALRVAS